MRRESSIRVNPFSVFVGGKFSIPSPSRIKQITEIDFAATFSITPDARHVFVKLSFLHAHFKYHHQVIVCLQSTIQKSCGVLTLQTSLHSMKYNSFTCGKIRTVTIQHTMADNPASISWETLLFTNNGMDYYGLISVTDCENTLKN